MKNFKLGFYFLLCFFPCWCFCSISDQDGNDFIEKDSSAFFENPIKKVVYTCICGNYDSLVTHSYVSNEWDYVCFTDDQELLRTGHSQWTVVPLAFSERDNTRNNRWHKMFPDKILGVYDVSLYVDGNINITNSELFDYIHHEVIEDESKTFVINRHYARNCIYREAEVCIEYQLDFPSVINGQMDILRQLNYPEQNGLTENFMIYRRHHDEQVKEIMSDWWWWVSNHSKRDQLSFNFVIWHRNFNLYLFEYRFSRKGHCLEFTKHQKKRDKL